MADFDYALRADIPRILIEAVPGEELSVTVPILDSSNAAVPISDASTWSSLAQLRTGPAAADVLHTFTSAAPTSNITINAGASGSVTLTATAAQTAAWQTAWTGAPPQAGSDLFVTDDTGKDRCLADLVFTLLPRYTRED